MLDAQFLQDYLGGEGGEDAGDDGAHGGVGQAVAVDGHVEGVLLQVLEEGGPPHSGENGLEGQRFIGRVGEEEEMLT